MAKDIKSKRVIGICHVSVSRDKGIGELIGHYGIVITREYRGMGLGKILSLVTFNIAKKLGVKLVRLHIDVDNIRAINLYTRLGFKIKKRVHKGDYRYTTREYIDYYIMEKILG